MQLLERKIDTYLKDWKNNPKRKPLIVKGARQIGKTESIKSLPLRAKHQPGSKHKITILPLRAKHPPGSNHSITNLSLRAKYPPGFNHNHFPIPESEASIRV